MAIVLVSLLAGCSSDKGVTPYEEEDIKEVYGAESGKATLKLLSGVSQTGRVKSTVQTRGISNKEALTFVAKIENPKYQADNKKWSATAIAIDGENNRVYVSWHSDRQATSQAQEWGGAIDVVDITDEDHPKDPATWVSPDMKFNHVFIDKEALFLGATSALNSGAIGRVALNANGDIPAGTETIDRLGFPGISVNAVAKAGEGLLMAVSGHSTGTYGTFAADIEARPYYYGTDEERMQENQIEVLQEEMKDFGGKFLATDENGAVYMLHNETGKDAVIVNTVTQAVTQLDTPLVSSTKYAETYDYQLGQWTFSNEPKADYYGKHTFAVYGGYAYVASGKNGFRVYPLNGGESQPTWKNKTHTTGVCTDGEYVYTATGAGLRIYKIKEGGELALVAFEVKTYDEDGSGAPTSKEAATTGTTERHSANFVAVHKSEDNISTYIYIAYGQSGVRVYKFTASEFMAELDPYTGIDLKPIFGLD